MKRLAYTAIALFILCATGSASGIAGGEDGVVNINTATEDELMLLPGVGPALAKRIIDLREAKQGFKASEELILVRGIGDRTFDEIEPYIVVAGETTLKEKVRSKPRQQREEG